MDKIITYDNLQKYHEQINITINDKTENVKSEAIDTANQNTSDVLKSYYTKTEVDSKIPSISSITTSEIDNIFK